ncbi:hypothetical protein LTR78_000863 [Recurvomyces mirabilis]|uniref:L domain-like protein n=1 Tax=Recurvomyces mirabilis TaxID=574656 RepID=A0AAE0WWI2_9PEZI|nr:hypothetical protein LTR78_000863 [Recurvomyces mirabilis]KAK5158832.1 hypothetical protein LTS14_002940 [Recurvomyces mirabilis]
MDASTTTRPTGIPRFCKLPVPNSKRPSQPLPPSSNVLDNYRPTAATPKLQKRASHASLNLATQAVSRDPSPARAANEPKPSGLAASRYGHKPPTGTLRGLARPSSRGNQQRAPQPYAKPGHQAENEENDQLGTLKVFRAASRQGFTDDPSPVEYDESVWTTDEELYRPKDRTKSRPSLSDRTIESLQQVPSTPKDRRQSSFFSQVESPMGPPGRSTSALSRNGSNTSRPGTSDGSSYFNNAQPMSPLKRAPASAKPASRIGSGGFGFTPASAKRRSASTAFSSKLQNGFEPTLPPPRSPSPAKRGLPSLSSSVGPTQRSLVGSKTLAARPSKPRPALADAFGPASSSKSNGVTSATPTSDNATPAKRVTSNPSSSSSAALREQIAAAKAAVRKEKAKNDSPLQQHTAQLEDFGTMPNADPFNLAPKNPKHVLKNRIKAAWTTGRLNIAALELKHIPEEVLGMFDAKAMEDGNVNWAEVVDLTKFVAADDELEVLDETLFPDKSAEELEEEEDGRGNSFGGLESLDLHSNKLQTLPLGLRRLERLTSLNLAHNKLDNTCLEVITQIATLKDLNLGHNSLSGNLPSSISSLTALETLDIQSNRLLGLPEALRELLSLRTLNVAGNQLTALPLEALQQVPLLEIDASSNMIIGSLFPLGGTSGHPTLKSLNVANNSIAALSFSPFLGLPALRSLDVTNNHLTSLPDVSGWTEMLTLMAGDNKIVEVPQGFAALRRLRTANFGSNEIRVLGPEIARMESLNSLVLAANPLKEKKFLTMTASDIKEVLTARLEPVSGGEADEEGLSDPETVIGIPNGITNAKASIWTVSATGILDLTNKNLSDDSNDRLGSVLKSNEVRDLRFSENSLTCVPPALWLGQDLQVLDLSNNAAFDGSDYFSAELELPVLQELNLAFCRLTSLQPLREQLVAPALKKLNLTANKLSGPVPTLRETFPQVAELYLKDNRFSSVSALALRSLHTVELTGNELASLPAELGLLWEQGLRHFEVGGNPFRVPGRAVLGKGTEAVLRWLRDRLPVSDGVREIEELD